MLASTRLRLDRRWICLCGLIAGCLMAVAWLAPAAFASDSIYWSSYTPNGAIRVGGLDAAGAGNLLGNLLCDVANLLNGNGGALASITTLLNQLLGALRL